MSLSIAAIVAGGLSLVAVVGMAAGASSNRRRQDKQWASGVWRDVTVRNGVTAVSPFHSSESSFNAPGMVEVFPRSHRHTQLSHPGLSAPVSEARLSQVSAIPKAVEQHSSTSSAPENELPSTPIELSDPPHPKEADMCRRMSAAGKSQTAVISELWGVPKGGSKRYQEARRRYRAHTGVTPSDADSSATKKREVMVNA